MKNNEPLVSIITPTYNHSKYIDECIKSVQTQTHKNWEMIIIDDGSTDETLKLAQSSAKSDSRIKVVTQENVGIFRLAETYNKALSISNGQYITILEGDDIWESEKLKLQIEVFFKNPEIVLCYGQTTSVSSNKQETYSLSPNPKSNESKYFNNDPIGSILNILLFRNCIPALTIMVKKESLEKIGGFKQSYNLPLVDLPTLYELALIGKFYFIPKTLGSWRIYANQVTKTFPNKITEGFFQLALNFYELNKTQKLVKLNFEKNDIINTYNNLLVISYSRAGRYKLIRKEFKEARKDYWYSIVKYGFHEPIWKIRSIIGIIFSFLHMDVEGISKLLGRKSYQID